MPAIYLAPVPPQEASAIKAELILSPLSVTVEGRYPKEVESSHFLFESPQRPTHVWAFAISGPATQRILPMTNKSCRPDVVDGIGDALQSILRRPARARTLTTHASNRANLVGTGAKQVIGIGAVRSPGRFIGTAPSLG